MNDTVKTIFGLIGGLAMFLYGMNSMSDALQKTAGEKMKKILGFLINNPVKNEMPIVAECGGFMYLHSFLKDKEGLCYDMTGVISATCFYTGKLVRFGYIELRGKSCSLSAKGINGKQEINTVMPFCTGEI